MRVCVVLSVAASALQILMAHAADVPMPSEAEVLAAVQKQGNNWKVCPSIGVLGFPLVDGVLKRGVSGNDHEVEFLLRDGYFNVKQDEKLSNDSHTLTLTDTKAWADVRQGMAYGCLGKRHVDSIFAFTPPAVLREYTVIHVGYFWEPSEKPAWAIKLSQTGAEPELTELLGKQQWANLTLVYTNHGWLSESNFGNPISDAEKK